MKNKHLGPLKCPLNGGKCYLCPLLEFHCIGSGAEINSIYLFDLNITFTSTSLQETIICRTNILRKH